LVGHLLFLFPGGHKDGRNYADAGEAGRHQPIAGNVAEAVDQHRGDGRQSKGKGHNEGDGDGGAGDVFEDERADRRLGAIDKSLKHVAAPWSGLPNRTEDEARDGCDRKRRHGLILDRSIQCGFHIASDFLHAFAGRPTLLSHATCCVFCLLSVSPHLSHCGIETF
jgi:hypothetical protein